MSTREADHVCNTVWPSAAHGTKMEVTQQAHLPVACSTAVAGMKERKFGTLSSAASPLNAVLTALPALGGCHPSGCCLDCAASSVQVTQRELALSVSCCFQEFHC